MVINKTYGALVYKEKKVKIKGKEEMRFVWSIESAQPHVCIKLKSIFPSIPQSGIPPFEFPDMPITCFDLLWFIKRYPLEISGNDLKRLKKGKQSRVDAINEIEQILLPDYKPKEVQLNEGYKARDYQLKGCETFLKLKRLLIGDDLGLGKTLTAILSFLPIENRPIAVVCQAHLQSHWQDEIQKYTGLTVHKVKTRTAYDLPAADVYIFKYTSLSGWVNLFTSGYFKLACFDEVQELRHNDTVKYESSKVLSENVELCISLSATPIYNYGNEIFSVLDCINPDCLGTRAAFEREWTSFGKRVKDPIALGTYLRENLLILRRTKAEVGRELPPLNKLVYTIEYDEDEMDKDLDLAKQLAITVINGSFTEKGQASVQLDALIRHATGLAKARSVAAFVKLLLDSGVEKILLSGWHRDVYEIWNKELAEYKPVMYTGSESPSQKDKSKYEFINNKEARVFIISNRSGIGLDGLQFVCDHVVVGELDYSNAVLDQIIGRVNRDAGDEESKQVTAIFLIADGGSDPSMVDILALKSSQQHGIINPMIQVEQQHTNDSRIKILAEQYLHKKGKHQQAIES